jgi:hypothetical protein
MTSQAFTVSHTVDTLCPLIAQYLEEDLNSPEVSSSSTSSSSWKVLVVDDDAVVHQVTQLAMLRFQLEGRSFHLLSAFLGEEAKRITRCCHGDK